MKRLLSLFKTALTITSLAALLCARGALADTPEQIPGTTRIDAEKLVELVQQTPDIVIIDARKADERPAGFIEGSVSLPDYDTTPERLAAVIPSKDHPVIFYCNGVKCGRSVKTSQMAVEAGYKKVYWFRGGWEEWTAKGMPVAFQ